MVTHDRPVLSLLLITPSTATTITTHRSPKQADGEPSDHLITRSKHNAWVTDTASKLVELKNGETFNGHLVNCDNFMNITLREVYQTSADGDRFWKLKECYIRGSTVSPAPLCPSFFGFDRPSHRDCPRWTRGLGMRMVSCAKKKKIKYLRVPDTLLDAVKEEQARAREAGRSARGAGPGPGRGTSSLFSSRSLIVTLRGVFSIHPSHPRRTIRSHRTTFSTPGGPGGRGLPGRGGSPNRPPFGACVSLRTFPLFRAWQCPRYRSPWRPG
jgi:U6 snRNA-associated Sm-like protein LSm4